MSFKNHFSTTSKQKGFTLIELLVVISVIAILASVSLINYSNVRAKARDTTRISDLDQLQKLLEVMKLDSEDGKYPLSTPGYQIVGYPWGSEYEGFGKIPEDPSSSSGHPNYAYSSNGDNYQIYVKFENEPVGSSFACSGSCGPEGGEYNGGVASDSLFGSLPSEGNEGGSSSTSPSSPPAGLSSAQARQWAKDYCATYFPNKGTSILNGVVVYCDQYNNMWAPTLPEKYIWSTENVTIKTEYKLATNNCNEIPSEYMKKYPACEECINLNYAGLTGWQLPSHSGELTGNYCYLKSQLWRYGMLCDEWGAKCSLMASCLPSWEGEDVSKGAGYWSASEYDKTRANYVHFSNRTASYSNKGIGMHVRCFLGEWEPL